MQDTRDTLYYVKVEAQDFDEHGDEWRIVEESLCEWSKLHELGEQFANDIVSFNAVRITVSELDKEFISDLAIAVQRYAGYIVKALDQQARLEALREDH